MRREQFSFTITDLAVFLGKSPVTLRQWERKGIIQLSRVGNDRRASVREVRAVAQTARGLGRITEERHRIIEATLTLLELIENGRDTGAAR